MANNQPDARNQFIVTLAFFVVVIAVFIAGHYHGKYRAHKHAHDEGLHDAFQAAIYDAAEVEPEEVSDQLFAITDENKQLQWRDDESGSRLKVAAWMNTASYDKYYAKLVGSAAGETTPPGDPVVWVTLVPQVKQFCSKLTTDNGSNYDPSLRIKQYLGLAPSRPYARFVEMWVKPDDLLRPCPDPETDDRACNLEIDIDNPPTVENVSDYPAFFTQLMANSYHSGGAPWTRLGYTYDWVGGGEAVGASEYMLVPEAHYLVEASYGTSEYCAVQ